MKESKNVAGNNTLPKGNFAPSGSPMKGDSEKSVKKSMESNNWGGPLPNPASGRKDFTTDKVEPERKLTHPKPSEAMKTGRI